MTDPSAEIKTVSFVSLGCPKNLVDSEHMLGELASAGVAPVSAEDLGSGEDDDLSLSGSEQDASAAGGRITPADAVVVNTCGFLEASKEESLAVIRDAIEAKKRGEVKRVVVAGCLVQRHRTKLFEWAPGIDAMIGVFDRDQVLEAVRGTPRETLEDAVAEGPKYWISANALTKARSLGPGSTTLTVNGKDGKGLGYHESDSARLRLTPRHYAYLRISEGCNQACAFCTIPSIRGKMRSKREPAVVAEARELMRDGARELLLIGQDTTSYGDDIGAGMNDAGEMFTAGLPKLLKSLSDAMDEEIGAAGWLRLMYAYPTTFTDPIIDAFAELVANGRLLPYLDIPLQHASDNMLTSMRRNVGASEQRELMLKLRERIPGMAIRTTFVTGFPGETEEDHEELLGFIDEIGFDAVGVFRYSAEPGTPAATMEADPALAVSRETKQRRHNEIMELQQRIAFEQAEFLAEQFEADDPLDTGLRLDVVIDEPAQASAEAHTHRGRAYFQAPKIDATTYVVSSKPLEPGAVVPCVVTDSDGYDLIATPIADLAESSGAARSSA
ncbi:MAG: 30S ribosomal protein S12 methylthiotransferase RimO [Phycisphaerae bacterium]|nr:30S ribosomal protein S12 methylthiotransferase RimO [Phycisphaerae bacterium]